jgi:hypothetical protein
MKTDRLSRRKFIGSSALVAAGVFILPKLSFANSFFGVADKPNSVVDGY